jgi:7-cyano-7-deazaguanine synthase in queuosine biosynthesis
MSDYYRVIYDTHFFRLIESQLQENHIVISPSSRSQMIDDYFKSSFASNRNTILASIATINNCVIF